MSHERLVDLIEAIETGEEVVGGRRVLEVVQNIQYLRVTQSDPGSGALTTPNHQAHSTTR